MSSATAFNLPPQDLAAPSQFAARPEALEHWLASLPRTNLGQTSRSLYQALTELNRVKLEPALRLQLQEALRPSVHFVLAGLQRHYLNQPIVLPEQAEKVSQLAHVLQQQLAVGYVAAALEGIGADRPGGLAPPALATCLHRAITELSQILLRDFSLYRDPHRGCWHRLHQLAQLAWQQGVEHLAVQDDSDGHGSIEAAYLRALLLGSAKTHQLRQSDLPRVYRKLLGWSRSVSLCGPAEGLLSVDPAGDSGPIYRDFAAPGPDWLGLETRALARQLMEELPEVAAAEGLISEAELSSDLLGHLAHTWSTASKRAFLRIESNEEVDIALGLAAAHHFLAGEVPFNQLLTRGRPELAPSVDNPFLRQGATRAVERRMTPRAAVAGRGDVWDSIYSQPSGATQVSLETIEYHIRTHQRASAGERERERYRSFRVRTVNLSPGGFCLSWPPENPAQIRTGEIVGLRENESSAWRVGVVRWVRLQGKGPQLGIELLAPTAAPHGARVVNKSGAQGDWLRVLVLPELPQIDQPATLITPRLPFRENQKVELQVRDHCTRIQLGRRIKASAAFSQFEFRHLGGQPHSETAPTARSGFESLWEIL